MSGGSYDYVYSKIEDITIHNLTPERVAFQKHLKLVAKAMKAIEWVDSCDCSPGDESEAIRKCLSSSAAVEEWLVSAEKMIGDLRAEIALIKWAPHV